MKPVKVLSLLTFVIPHLVTGRWWTSQDACPTEIKATIPYSYYCNGPDDRPIPCEDVPEPYLGTMVSVHDALSHCPNITSLDLRVTLIGCSEWPDRWNFPFAYNGGDTYPKLKTLRLEGYEFSSTEDAQPPWLMPNYPRNSIVAWTKEMHDWLKNGYWKPWLQTQLGIAQTEPSKSNLDLWLGAMDWSGIEELAISDSHSNGEVLEKLPPLLSSLRKLDSTDLPFIEALPNNTLTHLTWLGPSKPNDLPRILSRQGATLQNLEFRCEEMNCKPFQSSFNISILPEQAPNLTHLALNIPRNGTWPLSALQTLASLPQLRSLAIYSNLESECQAQKPEQYSREFWTYLAEHGQEHCSGEDRFQKPLLDENSAEELFRLVKQANEGGMLENVTLRVGDWTRPWDGPLYSEPWMEDRKAEVVCSGVGKGERQRLCEMTVSQDYWPLRESIWN